jgi:hypothetical protein
MAIRHNYTLLCENVIRDVSGKLSFINVFQNVELEQTPGILAHMFVAVNLVGDPGDTYQISLDPPGKNPPLTPSPVEETVGELVGEARQYQQASTYTIFGIGAVLFVVPGVYHITLRSKGKVIHRQPFGVYTRPRTDEATNVRTL